MARSTRRLVIAALLIAVSVLYARGPRATVGAADAPLDTAGRTFLGSSAEPFDPTTLAALPAFFDSLEARAGVVDTAVRKRVRFAHPDAPARTRWTVVYLHGFTATRQETAPLAESIADALGANLFETRLTGHGLPGDSLARATAQDWIDDARQALHVGSMLGDSVLLIGTSTGGTLAAWLASAPAAQRRALARVVLISPNFGPRDRAAAVLTLPWAQPVLTRLIPTRAWQPMNDEHRRFWTIRYPSAALFPMQALVEATRERPLDTYSTPTLIVFAAVDSVVDPARTRRWMQQLHAATPATPLDSLLVVPRAGEDDHVIVGRITAPSQVVPMREAIVAFVRR